MEMGHKCRVKSTGNPLGGRDGLPCGNPLPRWGQRTRGQNFLLTVITYVNIMSSKEITSVVHWRRQLQPGSNMPAGDFLFSYSLFQRNNKKPLSLLFLILSYILKSKILL